MARHTDTPDPAGTPEGDESQPNPYWREPPPPPAIPELLTRPASLPKSAPKPESIATDLTGFGKAWGTALDFVFTILAGTGLGWLGGKYIGPPTPWVLGGLTLGFVVAFIRIVRATTRDERDQRERKNKSK